MTNDRRAGTTPGKRKGLEEVANSEGVIAALAIDQRSAMRKLFAKAMGIDEASVPAENLIEYKAAVSRILTPFASAILLDPEYGLAAAKQRAKTTGLLLAYEQTGYDKRVPGRLPRLLEDWSVHRLVEAGANSVKILLYYSTTSTPAVNEQKHAFVERVGAECVAADVPFFLELVSYAEGMEDKSADFARLKPEIVAGGIKEFSKPRYCVDVLKVGMPVNLAYTAGSPSAGAEILYRRAEAIEHYRNAAAAASVPFIYLSEGVSNETFLFGLELAAEANVDFSGVLCGRATWQDGVPIFVTRGLHALEDWLQHEGIQNIENVNRHLTSATPWFERSLVPLGSSGGHHHTQLQKDSPRAGRVGAKSD
jgi:tagatose 1,6-diphosphate aldolase